MTKNRIIVVIGILLIIAVSIIASFIMGRFSAPESPPQTVSQSRQAAEDADDASKAADTAASSARKAADSAETSAQDTAKSAKDQQESINQRNK